MEFESHLRDSVLEQAHENGRQLLADAKESIEREAKEQEARLKQEKLQQREQEIKAINRQVQREVQQLENEKRQSTLATKEGILKELFAGAYDGLVDRAGAGFLGAGLKKVSARRACFDNWLTDIG